MDQNNKHLIKTISLPDSQRYNEKLPVDGVRLSDPYYQVNSGKWCQTLSQLPLVSFPDIYVCFVLKKAYKGCPRSWSHFGRMLLACALIKMNKPWSFINYMNQSFWCMDFTPGGYLCWLHNTTSCKRNEIDCFRAYVHVKKSKRTDTLRLPYILRVAICKKS